jgi:hypothetical protein
MRLEVVRRTAVTFTAKVAQILDEMERIVVCVRGVRGAKLLDVLAEVREEELLRDVQVFVRDRHGRKAADETQCPNKTDALTKKKQEAQCMLNAAKCMFHAQMHNRLFF